MPKWMVKDKEPMPNFAPVSSAQKLIIFCGPSGSGKTTLARALLDADPRLCFSISATTRKPRAGEENGREYHFMAPDEFRKAIAENRLLEYEEVYQGTFYGTMRSEIERIARMGKVAVLDIDVLGALNIKRHHFPDALVLFVDPGSKEELERRLQKRASEDQTSYQQRLARADKELELANSFDERIENRALPMAIKHAADCIGRYLEG